MIKRLFALIILICLLGTFANCGVSKEPVHSETIDSNSEVKTTYYEKNNEFSNALNNEKETNDQEVDDSEIANTPYPERAKAYADFYAIGQYETPSLSFYECDDSWFEKIEYLNKNAVPYQTVSILGALYDLEYEKSIIVAYSDIKVDIYKIIGNTDKRCELWFLENSDVLIKASNIPNAFGLNATEEEYVSNIMKIVKEIPDGYTKKCYTSILRHYNTSKEYIDFEGGFPMLEENDEIKYCIFYYRNMIGSLTVAGEIMVSFNERGVSFKNISYDFSKEELDGINEEYINKKLKTYVPTMVSESLFNTLFKQGGHIFAHCICDYTYTVRNEEFKGRGEFVLKLK